MGLAAAAALPGGCGVVGGVGGVGGVEADGACVAIHGGATPCLRGNQIHYGKQSGVCVYDNGLGTLEDNDITANARAGVEITTGGNPTLRGNQINRNRRVAVQVYKGGKGLIEGNDLTGNRFGLGISLPTPKPT